ncbi:MAG: DUF2281 domain-containing protein [Methylococcales bacterium]
MQLPEKINQHLLKLSPSLQSEVFDFVLFLEQKQAQALQKPIMNDDAALAIHQQLMDDYAETFEKLAQ